jgi:septum formation topological specificity factor MinE
MVMAPAKTGNDNKSRIVVIITDQTNKGIRSSVIPFLRMLIAVVMKFTDPKMDEIPAK